MVSPSTIPVIGAFVRRVSLAIQWRIDEQVSVLDERFHALSERMDQLEHRAGVTDRRVDDELRFVVDEVKCIGPQVASIEQRMENARVAEAPSTPELVDARTEHARARARLTAVSRFEERLRRVEQAVDGSAVTG